MLDTSSHLDQSGQVARAGVDHGFWPLDAWTHQSAPMTPAVTQYADASLPPAATGSMLSSPLGFTPLSVPPVRFAAGPSPAPAEPQGLAAPPGPPTALDLTSQMRAEIASLRQEVVNSNKDMWSAVKMISSTVKKDQAAMQAITQDVQALRGRHGGGVPQVATECSVRQSSCSECLAVESCVWCKVEQRCYSGDSAGPVKGECALFRHGTCDR